MINISTEEIKNRMFFIHEEDNDHPIAVIKVGDLLEFNKPKGEWIVEKNQFGDILHCSICGARPRRSEYGYDLHDKFCNECGADMRKGSAE